jgi:hypothetical protein
MAKKSTVPVCAEIECIDCEGWPCSLVFGANDQTLIANAHHSPRIYERPSGKRLAEFVPTLSRPGQGFRKMMRVGPQHFAGSQMNHLVVWNADGTEILTTYDSWQAETNGVLVHCIAAFAMSSDRQQVVFCEDESKLLVCTPLDDKRPKWLIQGKTTFASQVALSTDENFCITGGNDKSVRLWDMRNGHEVHLVGKHDGFVQAVQPISERHVATAGRDRLIRVWDVFAPRELFQLAGHKKEIRALALTSDGRLLISVGGDGARVWDLAGQTCVGVFQGHGKSIACVAISSDNRLAATAGHDGRLRVWSLP